MGENIKKFDSLQASIESILILAYCILYFYEQINKPQVGFIYAQYTFWIVTGLLIYLAGTFFLYVFALYFSHESRAEYWVILHICNIFKNLLFAIAILIHAKEPKTTKSKTITEPDYQLF